jgi:WD40 repeat protein
MSRIFLSHSSADELEAVALKTWLAVNGWDDVFLDLDPRRGLVAGERWQEALRRAADRCEAVVFVVTPAWSKSKWCLAEFLLAKNLNKRIFGAILKTVDIGELPIELTSEWQLCRLVGDGPHSTVALTHRGETQQIECLTDGLTRLRIGLENAGLDPRYFAWPPPDDPKRPPYRGLSALEEKDAAIFFGRDAQIVRGLDALRGMRAGGVESLFVILGSSATGKSSFLRAGLLPRLRRDDRHFLPLEVIRPEHQPIRGERGLAVAIHQARLAFGVSGETLGAIKEALGTDIGALTHPLADIQLAARDRLAVSIPDIAPPTLLLCVDQTEELFSPDATDEARRFLAIIGETLRNLGSNRSSLIVAFTIRSDRYELLQAAPELAGLKSRVFDDLKPIPPAQFKEIITGPARRATEAGNRLEVRPDLVDRLLSDCAEGADTLPLLSLTLARLYRDFGSDGDLRLDEYDAMGGMRSVVNHEVDGVLARDPAERQAQLKILQTTFIPWLATINPQNDQPMRRVARRSDLPQESHPLIDALVDKRLLLSDEREGEKVIEVAHEALLRQWDTLANWLRTLSEDLKLSDGVERAADEWEKSGRNDAWLMVGERLSIVETLASKAGFARRLGAYREFLRTSRQREDARRDEEERHRKAELEGAQRLAAEQTARADAEAKARTDAQASAIRLRKRSQLLGIASVLIVLAFIIATWQWDRASKQFRQATALQLIAEAQGMLSGARSGGDERAFMQLLAMERVAPGAAAEGGLLTALLLRWNLQKIATTDAQIRAVAFSPSGTRIISGDSDGTLRLWDANTGQPIGDRLTGHSGGVSSVAFSPDSARIVAGSSGTGSGVGILRLWDAKTGQPVGASLQGISGVVTSVAFSNSGSLIVSGDSHGTLRLWDASTRQPVGEPLQGNEYSAVLRVAFSPDNSRILAALDDGTVFLWDADTRQRIGEPMKGPSGKWSSAAFNSGGNRIAFGGWDGTLSLWDLTSHQAIGEVKGSGEGVLSVAFSPDGSRIVSGGLDSTLRLWDASTSQQIGEPLRGHEGGVFSVAFSPDGSRILSGGDDTTVRLWDAETDQMVGKPLHEGGVSSVAFSHDGSHIVSGGVDCILRVWDAKTGQPVGEPLTGHESTLVSGAFHPQRLHSACAVLTVAFSPDGGRIVSGGEDSILRTWDARTGQQIGESLQGHGDVTASIAFSPDGSRIVSSGGDEEATETLLLWNVKTRKHIGEPLQKQKSGGWKVAFSPDSTRIVSGDQDGTLRLWDGKTGRQIGDPLPGHKQVVSSVAFSPDGSRIVSGSGDRTLRLWDAKTGRPVGGPLEGHKGDVLSVAFSPDGRWIVSGDDRGTLRFWDAKTRQPIGEPLQGHNGYVLSIAFSPDGSRIIAGGLDGTLFSWPAPKSWPDELCKKLSRNMSPEEWGEWVSKDYEFKYVVQCSIPRAR